MPKVDSVGLHTNPHRRNQRIHQRHQSLTTGRGGKIPKPAATGTLPAWPYDSSSWLIGIQSTLTPDDGSGQTIAFEPKGYGPRPLKAGTLRLNIFVNTTGEVDKTLTPRLYKID